MTAPDESKKNEPATAPHASGLRAARKERQAAKKSVPVEPGDNVREIGTANGAKKAAKKAPAKKAAAKKASPKPPTVKDRDNPWYTRASYTPVSGQQLYEATGESGQIAVRSCATKMTHAISWAHVDQPGERAKAVREGVIVDMYPSEEAAKKALERYSKDAGNDRLVIVPARPYKGK